MQKEITVVLYGYRITNHEWSSEVNEEALFDLLSNLHDKLISLGVTVSYLKEPDNVLEVNGYGDLLNTVRLRSQKDHISNLCLGHIIGQSPNCDLLEDIRRGVYRVAFAPEMIEPEGSNRVVCHNCGCGC
jgi:hypothetical protein